MLFQNTSSTCVLAGVPVGHFNGGPSAVMPYMGMPNQNSMGVPQQSAIAQGMAAGLMPHSMHSTQSMSNQGMQPQSIHGDMMMQQHTHVQGPMDALGMDAFSSQDLLNDTFPNFPSPVVDTQSSSSQHQAESSASPGRSVKSDPQMVGAGSAPAGKNPSLQQNLRKLSVKGRAKSTGQAGNPDELFTNAMQNVQMQMSMAMPVVGPGSWLSPSTLDTSQDGVRRPPAA